jgi:hypothetical protein
MTGTSEPVFLRDETRFPGEDASIALGVELVTGCAGVDLALTRDAADVTGVGLRWDCGLALARRVGQSQSGNLRCWCNPVRKFGYQDRGS